MNNIYVLYGEEKSLIEKEIKKIASTILIDDFENKISKYSILETNLSLVLEDASIMPFLSDKKVILCHDCTFLTGTSSMEEKDVEMLLRYINNPNEKTILIFTVNNNKLDERKKIVKELKEKAIIKQFNKLSDNDLVNYIKKKCEEDHYKIDYKAINILIDRIENNIEFLNQEIDKLMLYKLNDKVITDGDIEEVVRKPISDDVFTLVDAVIKKDISKILEIYNQLLIINEEPIKIIAILANQFRLIYQTKKLYQRGYSEKDIASKLDIHPYRVKLANEVNIDDKTLLQYIDKLADLDIDIKTGKANKDIGLELFFLQL